MSMPYNINAAKPVASMESSFETQEKNRLIPPVYKARNASPNTSHFNMGTPSPPLSSLSNRMLGNSMGPSPLTLPPQQGRRTNGDQMLLKGQDQPQHSHIYQQPPPEQVHQQHQRPPPHNYQEFQRSGSRENSPMLMGGDYQHHQQNQIPHNHNNQIPHYASPQMFSKQGPQQLPQPQPPFEYGPYQPIQPLGQQIDQAEFNQYASQPHPSQQSPQAQPELSNNVHKVNETIEIQNSEVEGSDKHKNTIVTKFVPATEDDGSKKKRGRPKKYILDPATNDFIDSSHENFKRLNKLLKSTTKTKSKKLGDAEQHIGIVKGTSLKSLNDVAVQQLLEKKDKRGRPRKFPIEKTGLTIRGVRVSGTGRGPSEKRSPVATTVLTAEMDKVTKRKRGRPKCEESESAPVK